MRIAAGLLIVLLTTACSTTPGSGGRSSGPSGSTPAPSSGSSLPPLSDVLRSPRPTTQPRPVPQPSVTATGVDPALRPLVDLARADLARRLGVAEKDITVARAVPVTWSDASLGCPEPGRSYPQGPVDGALIELSAGGSSYRYHSGGNMGPAPCLS